ncbi:gamma-glutamyl-gamma-aminobutyrate hydrolase family protein [Microbacterium aurantiacum]|uniref:gamma-glutamyl-gamma-aminobutyrate hydrolase family protein n=1 Tax=Microbacterium aurantiacum TaxID=162393 RepID=UPI000C802505
MSADRVVAAPRIGVSTYLERARQGVWDVRAAFLPEVYLNAVAGSGGVALLLPPQAEQHADIAVAGLDGLILTGGADVQPELYGAERHPQTDAARIDRDAWELALFRAAERRRLPVLAICRGLQLVNVARGGTLEQHLPDSLGTDRYRIGGGVFAENEVIIEAETTLSQILGDDDYPVHSYHHQGIGRLGDGLVVSARSDDGLVQAVEGAGDGYLVGVQWHPEENSDDRRLFEDLVSQARAFAARQKEEAR